MPALKHGEHALILLQQVLVLFQRAAQLADIAFKPLDQLLLVGLQIFLGMLKFFNFAMQVFMHEVFKTVINGFEDEAHCASGKRSLARTGGCIA
jgi:hypothetical protein